MRQIRKILRDKRGEGYIDVAVMVLCVMLASWSLSATKK